MLGWMDEITRTIEVGVLVYIERDLVGSVVRWCRDDEV
jgi:hypothetical protein